MLMKRSMILGSFCCALVLQACADGTEDSNVKIQGGTVVTDQAWDAVMAIEVLKANGSWSTFCSGTYIGNRTLLTNGHCLNNQSEPGKDLVQASQIVEPATLRVRSRQGQYYGVQQVYVEPFRHERVRNSGVLTGMLQGLDLALIELDRQPIEKPALLAPVWPDADPASLATDRDVTLTGYAGEDPLKTGKVFVNRHLDGQRSVLALGDGHISACFGDSGGGIFESIQDSHQLSAVIFSMIPINLDPWGLAQDGNCKTAMYTGAIDLRQPFAQAFLARGGHFLEHSLEPVSKQAFGEIARLPGRIEAEHFVSGTDYSRGNSGPQLSDLHIPFSDVDVFAEGPDITFISRTAIGESLAYLPTSTLSGKVNLTLRARNSHPTTPGRALFRMDGMAWDLALNADSSDWQTITLPIQLKQQGLLRISLEILSPLDLDWFHLESAETTPPPP